MVQALDVDNRDAAPVRADKAARRILVVDDSRVQRKIISSQLARSGYEVIEAGSAEEALSLSAETTPDLVISDWVMPGMSGVEFCQALRSQSRDGYVYFIILTSKNETAAAAYGLDGGADDFLVKPVSGSELRARVSAGERILRMERELTDKNRLLSKTLGELQAIYDSLDRDLIEARKLQQSLMRERHHHYGSAEVTLLLRPSGHVGGDLVGFFQINDRRVGVFSIDVSGHGITSALMTARLAGFLSGNSPEHNMALRMTEQGGYEGRDPGELAAQLNRVVLREMQTETYFTLAYADVDIVTGQTRIVQAGHPHPAVQRRDGSIRFLGEGGLPIGLIDEAPFASFEITLEPGDRLMLMSDGITEAENIAGEQFGEAGVTRVMRSVAGAGGADLLDALVAGAGAHTGADFADDVSIALLDFLGPEAVVS